MNYMDERALIYVQTNLILLPGNVSYPIGMDCCVLAHDINADRPVQMSTFYPKAALYPPDRGCLRTICKVSLQIPLFKVCKGRQQLTH